MFHYARLASRLIPALALLGPSAMTTCAQADVNECAPVTIDGQNALCVSTTTSTTSTPDGDQTVTLTVTLAVVGQLPVTVPITETLPISELPCVADGQPVFEPEDEAIFPPYPPSGRVYGVGVRDHSGYFPGRCDGVVGLTIQSFGPQSQVVPPTVGTAPWTPVSQPYHVPQVCVTTGPGACVGPLDGTLSPSLLQPTLKPPSLSPGSNSRYCLDASSDMSTGQYAFAVEPSPDEYGSYGWGCGFGGSVSEWTQYFPWVLPEPQGP